ncbi:MAG: nitroreductase family protein [Bacteroidetes bacterium]|nr:nitroreductase family protein [Bacteroidota bacterium]MBU1578837.1 nitroreductase family protein [Bacteroidota bacterium]MBU2465877.1 nitroreductase family protein [Bacteroidota bacterium]MBU2558459.1 nitroreductase family protein [Bacteroidota bacterium]
MPTDPKNLTELVKRNRSYRKFDHNYTIAYDDLLKMVDLARLTPSSKNMQPLKYLVVHDSPDEKYVFSHLKWAWYLKEWSGPSPEERPSAYIIMLLDTSLNDRADFDAGIAAQTILLAATEMGLGGCIIRTLNRYELAKYFMLEPHLEILLVIALGKPTQQVIIDEMDASGSTAYFTDDENRHHVPKRNLKEIIWKQKHKS